MTHINDEHAETTENLDIIMPMCNLFEYSDNYADFSGSLWQFKIDEQNMTNARNLVDVTVNGSSFFIYKSNLLGNPADSGVLAKIVVLLKYLRNFSRSLEMSLINCKIHLEISWTNNCVLSNIDEVTTFQIKSTKLYVPVFTLSTKVNVNFTKQLNEGFKRPV